MNQLITGKFILQKRKEKNLTQEQLAEKLGVSNKIVSRWETGKCMPAYSIVKTLCEELNITVEELINGEEAEEKSVSICDEEQMIDLLRRTQEAEKRKGILVGVVLITMGIVLQAISHRLGGTNFKDFVSGIMFGLAMGEMLVGVYIVGKSFAGR